MGRLSVCLAECTDEGPQGSVAPAMSDGDQIRSATWRQGGDWVCELAHCSLTFFG